MPAMSDWVTHHDPHIPGIPAPAKIVASQKDSIKEWVVWVVVNVGIFLNVWPSVGCLGITGNGILPEWKDKAV